MSVTTSVHREVFERYRITARIASHSVEFRAVKLVGLSLDEPPRPVPYDGDFDEEASTEDLDAAPPFWSGRTKWDGCSDWDLLAGDDPAHLCGRDHATGIGRLIGRMHDIAAEVLPTFDRDLGA